MFGVQTGPAEARLQKKDVSVPLFFRHLSLHDHKYYHIFIFQRSHSSAPTPCVSTSRPVNMSHSINALNSSTESRDTSIEARIAAPPQSYATKCWSRKCLGCLVDLEKLDDVHQMLFLECPVCDEPRHSYTLRKDRVKQLTLPGPSNTVQPLSLNGPDPTGTTEPKIEQYPTAPLLGQPNVAKPATGASFGMTTPISMRSSTPQSKASRESPGPTNFPAFLSSYPSSLLGNSTPASQVSPDKIPPIFGSTSAKFTGASFGEGTRDTTNSSATTSPNNLKHTDSQPPSSALSEPSKKPQANSLDVASTSQTEKSLQDMKRAADQPQDDHEKNLAEGPSTKKAKLSQADMKNTGDK